MVASAANSPESFEGRLTACCQTDVGQAREQNEDNHGEAGPEETGRGWLYIVADGMGGAAAGQTASKIAVEDTRREYCDYIKAKPLDSPYEALKYAIGRANKAIFDKSRADESCRGMGTTIVAMAIVDDMVYTAHVGDSRIYRWRDGRLELMMRDHTRVQVLTDQGIITPAEANDHPESHVINRNLGGRQDVEVDTPADGPFKLRDGDTYLLCSDGLHGLVSDESILTIINKAPPSHATPALIALANLRGGYDNITVSVITAGDLAADWSSFEESGMASLLEELSFDAISDTALFEAYDPDATGPADFETGRMKAVKVVEPPEKVGLAPGKKEAGKPKGGAARNTVMLDGITVDMLKAASSQANAATAQVAKTAPHASVERRGPNPLLIVGLFGVFFFFVVVLIVVGFAMIR